MKRIQKQMINVRLKMDNLKTILRRGSIVSLASAYVFTVDATVVTYPTPFMIGLHGSAAELGTDAPADVIISIVLLSTENISTMICPASRNGIRRATSHAFS